ncbi:3-oxoacid CoA-transferase subunit A [Virgibacillus dakarensis]|nr:3-oxoacid CoA-transferase subunit A [Virgibacillus dakarensis]
MQKVVSADYAISLIQDRSSLMVGGFGLVGNPLTLIQELINLNIKDLTIISNNLGEPGKGLGKLVLQKKIDKAIGSYFTSNQDVVKAYLNKELKIKLLPQGTLAEAIRAGGAGIGGFYVPAGIGTEISEKKNIRIINGKNYLFQESLQAGYSLIKAYKADELGNLVYRKSSRNFNPIMATAGKIVIAEVEEIVPTGELSSEKIVTPHLYVDYIVLKKGDKIYE